MEFFRGIPVVVSPVLPIAPKPGEEARRIVRHGLADVLRWLGEEVGPRPGAETHVMLMPHGEGGQRFWMSRAMFDRLRARRDELSW